MSDPNSTLATARGNAVHLARLIIPRREQTRLWCRDLADGTATALIEVQVLATEVLLSEHLVSWDSLLDRMRADDEFGVALAIALARQNGDAVVLTQPTDSQLTELWRWLDARWSSQTDTFGSGFLSEDERVRNWRNSIVAELQQRATPGALAALAGLVASHPDNYRLQTALAEAEARDHEENWQGVQVAELTALLANARRTLVNDDDALHRAVLRSLDRFADRMGNIGQTLWNETRPAPSTTAASPKVWRPKYESDVSAALHDHLVQDFGDQLVVNREVLVRQTTSTGPGLSVDVLPTATQTATGRRLPSCPIEVKGNWNPDLLTDLQTQLVEDYLPATGATRGVYVCAWFDTEHWDDLADSRRRTAVRRDRDQVLLDLERAAEAASQSGNFDVTAVIVDIPRPTPSSRAGTRPSALGAPSGPR